MGALTTRWDTRLQIPSAIAMRDLAIGDIVKVIFHNITRSQCERRNWPFVYINLQLAHCEIVGTSYKYKCDSQAPIFTAHYHITYCHTDHNEISVWKLLFLVHIANT